MITYTAWLCWASYVAALCAVAPARTVAASVRPVLRVVGR